MSLATANSIAQAGLNAITAQTQVLSRNIAGANDTGSFSTKVANVATIVGGGAEVVSVSNVQNQTLFDNMLDATASSATQTAISAGLSQLQTTIGATSDATDASAPATLLSNLTNALQSYEASPSDSALADSAVSSAKSLAQSLNSATTTVQGVRAQADAGMAQSVSQINTLLQQFQTVNAQIMSGTATGSDVTDAQDSRNTILTQLAQQIGITTVNGPNNSMNIYTDSGVTLFQGGAPNSVTFDPTTPYTASTTGNAVYVDGVPITGSSSTMPIQSGNLAGLANLRDNVTVTYQAQLDSMAGNLISDFAETDQSGGGGSNLPGLFTTPGATSVPTSDTGLAGTIEVNASVDPSQGGNVLLLRDGGISGNSNYVANTSGNASYTGYLSTLLSNLSASTSTFDSAGQIGTTNTLAGYANDSVSWLEAQRSNVSSASTYQSTLLSQATTALSNTTGVNIDSQMSQMLGLENSYQASAKVLSTINAMFSTLLYTMGVTT